MSSKYSTTVSISFLAVTYGMTSTLYHEKFGFSSERGPHGVVAHFCRVGFIPGRAALVHSTVEFSVGDFRPTESFRQRIHSRVFRTCSPPPTRQRLRHFLLEGERDEYEHTLGKNHGK